MPKRFLTIWFRYLKTDWFTIRHPETKHKPLVLVFPDHGRMIVTACNKNALNEGITHGMALADARAISPSLQVFDDKPDLTNTLLHALAVWFVRYTPVAAIDRPDGLVLESTGCDHLWGGEDKYVESITNRLKNHGYHVRAAIADTIGAAWAVTRFGNTSQIIASKEQTKALMSLPPEALRLEMPVIERMHKLGLKHMGQFMSMPRSVLRRRFGNALIQKLDQAMGLEEEIIHPVQPPPEYHERLPCLEPITTATGIGIALNKLLETVCLRLKQDEKGLRQACFNAYRVDGKVEKIGIGTNRPSHDHQHLFKLFEFKLPGIEPALGIELFTLDVSGVQDASPVQEELWAGSGALEDTDLSQFVDRLANRIGGDRIRRYLPVEQYWPERSVKTASAFHEKPATVWKNDKPRPIQLLPRPEPVEVTSALPDYPPMMFRYKNKLHKIIKADGPERIEAEWWLQEIPHRDYYCVEDESGSRYWLFRSGHYEFDKPARWFIHGYFA